MFGLYSTPTAVAPRLAAVMTVRQIHVVFARGELRDVEHAVDQCLRRRYPNHVLARLADARLELFRERGAGDDDNRQARKRQRSRERVR
jgi:hypothetical protein